MKKKKGTKIGKFYYKKKNDVLETLELFSKISFNISLQELFFGLGFALVVGLIIGCLFKSVLIALILGVGLPIIFIEFLLYIKKNIEIRIEKQIISYAELIKNSFMYTNSVVNTIKEITPRVNEPIKKIFQEFLDDIEIYNISNKNALDRMKNKLKFSSLNDLIEQLILCEQDRRFITSFITTVQFLTDKREFLQMYEYKIKDMFGIFIFLLLMINGMVISLYFILNEIILVFLNHPGSNIVIGIYAFLQITISYFTLEKIIHVKF